MAAALTPQKTSKSTSPATTRTQRGSIVAGGKAAQNERALSLLTELCSTLGIGERLPLHAELMRRFDVSERAILRAFDDLQREGHIIRKPGMGTLVAEPRATIPGSNFDVGNDRPASSAPALTLSSANCAIIAVAHSDHSFYERCLDQLCSYADDAGFPVFCKPLRVGEAPTVERLGAISTDPSVCRFVFFGYPLMPLARQIQDRGGRVVVIGTPAVGAKPDVPLVHGNQEYGGYLVTQHLIERGHRRIAFVHYDDRLDQSLRWQGHQRALRDARRRGIEVTDTFILDAVNRWEADPEGAATFLRLPDAPTALVLWNDHEAIHMLSVLQRAGIRVPEDVAVAGYDGLAEGKITHPSLTTVDSGMDHQLRAAMDRLAEEDGPNGALTATVIIPTLIVRESTSTPRREP